MNELYIKYLYNKFVLKKNGNDINRIGLSLLNSKIRLTPHQIDAALFSFKSPINKGVLLSDEVGLGKTIEAGIIIAQLWYEKQEKILIIAPASLVNQWNNELQDKFLLSSYIMDGKQYKLLKKQGYVNPFMINENIIICSYNIASLYKEDILNSKIGTVVIDEAHKLRNFYTGKSIISSNIKDATVNMKKILLTATPIQNSLMDLFGLSKFIDDDIFGDKEVFRENYIKNYEMNIDDLNDRLKLFMHRTLREQVKQYIKYTNRIAKTFSFVQTQDENEIYNDLLFLILESDDLPYIIPKKQKHLLMLILTKLMGSSVYALQGTLTTIYDRLKNMEIQNKYVEYNDSFLYINDFEINNSIDEIKEEKFEIDIDELNREKNIIYNLIEKTKKIKKESKYYTLLNSLNYAFEHLGKIGAEKKVLIFTESRRTQDFLYDSLREDGYKHILKFNGTNSDDESNCIYENWINRPENRDKLNNSRSTNMRAAIIEKFKDDAEILIATEAGAEGLNLQFCSLVINYDLPWNPQRVEQRIGRCHRFGQKFDVTVINYINESNYVEKRIFELLKNKFKIFDEVFGASDEILGTLENLNDIEKNISLIYQKCRSIEEIDSAFDELQKEYDDEIRENIDKTKQKIIDNFEEDIQKYFNETLFNAEQEINNIEKLFWKLTKYILNDCSFDDSNYILKISNNSKYDGLYQLTSRNENNNYLDYSINCDLGKYVLEQARNITKTTGTIIFDISNYPNKITQIEKIKNKKGILSLNKLSVNAFDNEEYLFFVGILDDGKILDDDLCNKLLRTYKYETNQYICNNYLSDILEKNIDVYKNSIINESIETNNKYLYDEIEKINRSYDDKIQAIEKNIDDLREQRKLMQRQFDLARNVAEKEMFEKEIDIISKKIKDSLRNIIVFEEKVESDRIALINNIKDNNSGEVKFDNIFTVNFEIM